MSLLEINIPSGMEADTDSVDASEAHGQYTTIEKAFRKVNLFFDAVCDWFHKKKTLLEL